MLGNGIPGGRPTAGPWSTLRLKIKITAFSDKKEIENLISKFENFEKYIDNVISALNKKIDDSVKGFDERFTKNMEKAGKIVRGFEELAEKTPDLDKYFHLLEEEAKKRPDMDVKVEKIKTPGEDEKVKVKEEEEEEKESFFGKLKEKFRKKEE